MKKSLSLTLVLLSLILLATACNSESDDKAEEAGNVTIQGSGSST